MSRGLTPRLFLVMLAECIGSHVSTLKSGRHSARNADVFTFTETVAVAGFAVARNPNRSSHGTPSLKSTHVSAPGYVLSAAQCGSGKDGAKNVGRAQTPAMEFQSGTSLRRERTASAAGSFPSTLANLTCIDTDQTSVNELHFVPTVIGWFRTGSASVSQSPLENYGDSRLFLVET